MNHVYHSSRATGFACIVSLTRIMNMNDSVIEILYFSKNKIFNGGNFSLTLSILI